MRKLKTLLLLVLSLIIIGSTNIIIKANEKVSLMELFPNESLRKVVSDTLGESEEAEVDRERLLSIVFLQGDELNLSSFTELSPLENLEVVSLINEYELSDFSGIGELKKLEYLLIMNTSISSLKGLEESVSIEELYLQNPSVALAYSDDDVLEPIKHLPLQSLALINFGLTDEKAQKIGEIVTLEYLFLGTSRYDDEFRADEHWVDSIYSPLSNKLTNLDFVENLENLKELEAKNNQLTNIDGLLKIKDSIERIDIDTEEFGVPFSNTSSISDWSALFRTVGKKGVAFPHQTMFINIEAKVDLAKNEYYAEFNNLKSFHQYKDDGTFDLADLNFRKGDIPVNISETSTGYRISWSADAYEELDEIKWPHLFEVEMLCQSPAPIPVEPISISRNLNETNSRTKPCITLIYSSSFSKTSSTPEEPEEETTEPQEETTEPQTEIEEPENKTTLPKTGYTYRKEIGGAILLIFGAYLVKRKY